MNNKKFDPVDTLVKFECICPDVCDLLPDKKAQIPLKMQTN